MQMSNPNGNMIETYCAEDTYNAGVEFGAKLKSGDIVYLNGDMGTGKTEFTKGIAKGLEVEDYVVSPTFTIVNEYTGRCPLYHFDVYLSLIHISEPTRRTPISYAVFCLKKKKNLITINKRTT